MSNTYRDQNGNLISTLTFFNVQAFGAQGNGVNDDTLPIRWACDAAVAAGGGTVYFPPGTYLTGDQTFSSTTYWRGAGARATTIKLKATATSSLFTANINLIDLSIVDATGAVLQPISAFLYLPQGWDIAWRNAKANVGSQKASVVVAGDSIAAGQNATDIMINSWWALFRAAILAANGNRLGGDFYSLLYSSTFGLSTATPPVVMSGSGSFTGFLSGFNETVFNSAVALTPYVSCTPPYAVTGFDILYMDFAAGSWTWNIDGGSNTTVTTTGPGTNAGAIVKRVQITGLASGIHTLNVNCIASANTCAILGFAAYASTTNGFNFANLGWAGMGLVTGQAANNALSDTAKFPPDRLALVGQGYQGTTAAPTALTGLGFPTQPDLAIIAFGVNDSNQAVTNTAFRDALDRLIYSLRYGKNDACSIIIMAMYTGDGNLASSTVVTNQDYTGAGVTAYRDIKKAMLECAQANACAFVDVHGAFGRQPVTNGWVHSTADIHPTTAGYAKIFNLINAIV